MQSGLISQNYVKFCDELEIALFRVMTFVTTTVANFLSYVTFVGGEAALGCLSYKTCSISSDAARFKLVEIRLWNQTLKDVHK